MEGKPRCKKCGRILKSPLSIARGIGSVCAGTTSTARKTVHRLYKQDSGKAYDAGSSNAQNPILPAKPLNKRELHRQRREERRQLFQVHKAFQCGLLLPEKKPLVYEPLAVNNWRETNSGRVISHDRLQEYLKRYQFI